MRYSMTLLIADKKVNDFMECVDMKRNGKWYVSPCVANFSKDGEIKSDFFMKIIKASRGSEFYIPGIIFCDVLYTDDGVTSLSDGEREIVV